MNENSMFKSFTVEERSLSTDQIAQILRVPKRAIYVLVKKCSMPHFREGRKLRFYLSLVVVWVGDISRELKRRGLAPQEILEMYNSVGGRDE